MEFKILKLQNVKISQDWTQKALRGFENTMQNSEFPCIFALKAYKLRSILFLFVPICQPNKLIDGMMEYTDFAKITPTHKRIYNPLVIFFQNQFTNLIEEQTFAWQQLQFLHNNDSKEWLEHIPTNPNDSAWSFCFNEVELFFNISCPCHQIFKNRNLGNFIAFVVNPRENFDYVASGSKKQGVNVREIIRNRVKKYNNGYLPQSLGFFWFKG